MPDPATIRLLVVALTLAVALHTAEEFLALPGWAARNRASLPGGFAAPALRIRLAALLLTLAFVAAMAAALDGGAQSAGAYVFGGFAISMVAGAIAPHLALSLRTGSLMPGTLTALGLVLPLGLAFLATALRTGFVDPVLFALAGPAAGLALTALVWTTIAAFARPPARRGGFNPGRRA